MRYTEITKLMESEPVPKLSSLWKYSDEFSPDANERARQSAMREIENIRASNKQAAAERRGDRKNFEPKTFESFGIDLHAFMKDYCDSLYDFLLVNKREVADYVGDMTGVTPDNILSALNKHAGSPIAVAMEALGNPGPDVEDKYDAKLRPFMMYWRSINKLGPIGKEREHAALQAQIQAALN
jgi:hypothetical protein